ncbi:hypothetical protein BLNAU_7340 [Blattamonas nauphoetae]|uniref:Uncharacterized protein n=1 Tax=Blattamonas nauphoetae TaxID=2049346 RepID=A0ABQ9Y1T3_9EUKA|nr:hypothetical protein BLNAU_7340 [Blattamonas nauphoetae]
MHETINSRKLNPNTSFSESELAFSIDYSHKPSSKHTMSSKEAGSNNILQSTPHAMRKSHSPTHSKRHRTETPTQSSIKSNSSHETSSSNFEVSLHAQTNTIRNSTESVEEIRSTLKRIREQELAQKATNMTDSETESSVSSSYSPQNEHTSKQRRLERSSISQSQSISSIHHNQSSSPRNERHSSTRTPRSHHSTQNQASLQIESHTSSIVPVDQAPHQPPLAAPVVDTNVIQIRKMLEEMMQMVRETAQRSVQSGESPKKKNDFKSQHHTENGGLFRRYDSPPSPERSSPPHDPAAVRHQTKLRRIPHTKHNAGKSRDEERLEREIWRLKGELCEVRTGVRLAENERKIAERKERETYRRLREIREVNRKEQIRVQEMSLELDQTKRLLERAREERERKELERAELSKQIDEMEQNRKRDLQQWMKTTTAIRTRNSQQPQNSQQFSSPSPDSPNPVRIPRKKKR